MGGSNGDIQEILCTKYPWCGEIRDPRFFVEGSNGDIQEILRTKYPWCGEIREL
jgi:hypothetical protein